MWHKCASTTCQCRTGHHAVAAAFVFMSTCFWSDVKLFYFVLVPLTVYQSINQSINH